jgi:hypothetical protein
MTGEPYSCVVVGIPVEMCGDEMIFKKLVMLHCICQYRIFSGPIDVGNHERHIYLV